MLYWPSIVDCQSINFFKKNSNISEGSDSNIIDPKGWYVDKATEVLFSIRGRRGS